MKHASRTIGLLLIATTSIVLAIIFGPADLQESQQSHSPKSYDWSEVQRLEQIPDQGGIVQAVESFKTVGAAYFCYIAHPTALYRWQLTVYGTAANDNGVRGFLDRLDEVSLVEGTATEDMEAFEHPTKGQQANTPLVPVGVEYMNARFSIGQFSYTLIVNTESREFLLMGTLDRG